MIPRRSSSAGSALGVASRPRISSSLGSAGKKRWGAERLKTNLVRFLDWPVFLAGAKLTCHYAAPLWTSGAMAGYR